MNPAIEQAVKALERAVMLIETAWMDEEPLPCEQTGVDEIKKVAASLRALTEPSKTDDELARELADTFFANFVDGNTKGHEKQWAVDSITQAFAAIRAQARSEALGRTLDPQISSVLCRKAEFLDGSVQWTCDIHKWRDDHGNYPHCQGKAESFNGAIDAAIAELEATK